MAHPLVVNKRSGEPFDVYVGRPSEWGNPYSHKEGTMAMFRVPSVEQAVESYKHHLWTRLRCKEPGLIEKVAALHGKRLACWCAPGPCHAEVLVAASEWAVAHLNREGIE